MKQLKVFKDTPPLTAVKPSELVSQHLSFAIVKMRIKCSSFTPLEEMVGIMGMSLVKGFNLLKIKYI